MSSVRRTIAVMDLLAQSGPLGVRAVAQALRLPLGSVHRLLLDLDAEAVVVRTAAGEWELSYRLMEITGQQIERIEFPRLALPFCERIARATGESVNVSALSGLSGVCVDKVRGNASMQLDARIGSHGPLHCGGGGKAMLAWLPAQDVDRVLTRPLEPLTPHTITGRDALTAELALIRSRGYALDREEVVQGVHCIGMPLIDRTGRAVGAVSISGPSPKQPGPGLDPLIAMLGEACEHVSRRLGYRGPWPAPAPADAPIQPALRA